MGTDEHEKYWDSAVAGLPMAGWLGPIGRAWWLGAEPERRPGARQARGSRRASSVTTVFDDLPRCRPDVLPVRA